jgi:hypothetical protein
MVLHTTIPQFTVFQCMYTNTRLTFTKISLNCRAMPIAVKIVTKRRKKKSAQPSNRGQVELPTTTAIPYDGCGGVRNIRYFLTEENNLVHSLFLR